MLVNHASDGEYPADSGLHFYCTLLVLVLGVFTNAHQHTYNDF